MLTYEHIAWAAGLFLAVLFGTGYAVSGNPVVGVGLLTAPIPLQLVRLFDWDEVTPGAARRQRAGDAGVSADLDRIVQRGRPAEVTETEPDLFLPDCPRLDPR